MERVQNAISSSDVGVIVVYLVVTVAIGVVGARPTSTGDDLFPAGRKLTWPLIGFPPSPPTSRPAR